MKQLFSLIKNEKGQGAVEYLLILSVIVLAIVAVLITNPGVQTALQGVWDAIVAALPEAGS